MGMLLTALFALFVRSDDADKPKQSLIQNLAFKKHGGEVTITVYLTREVHPTSINLMESSSGSEESFTILSSIEEDVSWENDKSRFTFDMPKDCLKTGRIYSIQIIEKGEFYHSEAFVYDGGNCVFERNYQKRSNAGWIVALVLSSVALLGVVILIAVRICM